VGSRILDREAAGPVAAVEQAEAVQAEVEQAVQQAEAAMDPVEARVRKTRRVPDQAVVTAANASALRLAPSQHAAAL
jgi:predicted neutral ceramidase superfamily lipid hydrolase